jgi:AraC-like DNA-binding protein
VPARPLTASSATLLSILAYAEALDPGARRALERELRGVAFDDPDARVEAHLVPVLLAAAVASTGERAFGLRLALRGDPRRFGVLSYVTSAAANLGEGFRRAARYLALWNEGNELTLSIAGPTAVLEVRPRGRSGTCSMEGVRQLLELTTASTVQLARALTGTTVSPLGVELATEARAPDEVDAALYHAAYGQVPRFGVAVTRLVFDVASLALPLRGADPGLGAILTRHADDLLTRLGSSTPWGMRARAAIVQRLGREETDLGAIAKALGVSGRTLQRRLGEEGTAHDALVDAARHELATRYLRESDLSIGEITCLLGFADTSAFYRAFRRWTGTTPAEIRASLGGAPPR